MSSVVRRMGAFALAVSAVCAFGGSVAFAGTITPAGELITGTSDNTNFVSGSATVSCTTNTAVFDIPAAGSNNLPALAALTLNFSNCAADIGGLHITGVTVLGVSGHTIDVSASHVVTINIVDGIVIHIPTILGTCNITVGAASFGAGLLGPLSDITGLSVTGAVLPILTTSGPCVGVGSTGTFNTALDYNTNLLVVLT